MRLNLSANYLHLSKFVCIFAPTMKQNNLNLVAFVLSCLNFDLCLLMQI